MQAQHIITLASLAIIITSCASVHSTSHKSTAQTSAIGIDSLTSCNKIRKRTTILTYQSSSLDSLALLFAQNGTDIGLSSSLWTTMQSAQQDAATTKANSNRANSNVGLIVIEEEETQTTQEQHTTLNEERTTTTETAKEVKRTSIRPLISALLVGLSLLLLLLIMRLRHIRTKS